MQHGETILRKAVVLLACAAADAETADNGISHFQRDAASKDHDLSAVHLIYSVESSSRLGKGAQLFGGHLDSH